MRWNRLTFQRELTKLPDSEVFSDAISITGAGLDSFLARPTDSHLPALAQKSAGSDTDNTDTDIVVAVVAGIVVAIR